MNLLLRTSSNNEDYNADIEAAFVSIDKAAAEKLLSFRQLYHSVHKEEQSLWEMRFWGDFGAVYVTSARMEYKGDDLGNDDTLETPNSYQYEDGERMECRTLLVTSDGVRFQAYVKHTNVEITTNYVYWDRLAEIMTEASTSEVNA